MVVARRQVDGNETAAAVGLRACCIAEQFAHREIEALGLEDAGAAFGIAGNAADLAYLAVGRAGDRVRIIRRRPRVGFERAREKRIEGRVRGGILTSACVMSTR
jgi:hypothetical protein